jgi:predicted DNA-binding transcriptional regulator YafY
MAQNEKSKLKLLALLRIFWERTNESCPLTLEEIRESLAEEGIEAERKSLYSDINLLTDFGLPIEKRRDGNRSLYYLSDHLFTVSQLKLLTDAIGSARSIPEEEGREIVKKLKRLTDHRTARELDRQITVTGRVKHLNREFLSNIDLIQQAMKEGKQISFQYWEWTADKVQQPRREGKFYTVSPWTLIWEEENYYLLAGHYRSDRMHHYRVDRMMHMKISHYPRRGQEIYEKLDFSAYSRGLFGMFGGTLQPVTLRCKNELAGIVIERFGTDPTFFKEADGEHFTVTVRVVPCDLFYAWVMGFMGKMTIVSPQSAKDELKKMALAALEAME